MTASLDSAAKAKQKICDNFDQINTLLLSHFILPKFLLVRFPSVWSVFSNISMFFVRHLLQPFFVCVDDCVSPKAEGRPDDASWHRKRCPSQQIWELSLQGKWLFSWIPRSFLLPLLFRGSRINLAHLSLRSVDVPKSSCDKKETMQRLLELQSTQKAIRAGSRKSEDTDAHYLTFCVDSPTKKALVFVLTTKSQVSRRYWEGSGRKTRPSNRHRDDPLYPDRTVWQCLCVTK